MVAISWADPTRKEGAKRACVHPRRVKKTSREPFGSDLLDGAFCGRDLRPGGVSEPLSSVLRPNGMATISLADLFALKLTMKAKSVQFVPLKRDIW